MKRYCTLANIGGDGSVASVRGIDNFHAIMPKLGVRGILGVVKELTLDLHSKIAGCRAAGETVGVGVHGALLIGRGICGNRTAAPTSNAGGDAYNLRFR